MYDSSSDEAWFGELRTSAGNTVVVFHRDIARASSGRVYLYNTSRGSIIEYVEELVKSKLFDLEGDELESARKKYEKPWKAAKKEFLDAQAKKFKASEVKPVKKTVSLDDSESLDDDSYEYNLLFD
jgi:hypothetical protein